MKMRMLSSRDGVWFDRRHSAMTFARVAHRAFTFFRVATYCLKPICRRLNRFHILYFLPYFCFEDEDFFLLIDFFLALFAPLL